MAEGGYADISGGFKGSQNSLQDILAIIQGQKGISGMSSDIGSPAVQGQGVSIAASPADQPYMAASYIPPPGVSQTPLGVKPGLTGMQSPSQMAATASNGNVFNTKFVDRYSQAAQGPLDPNQHVAGRTPSQTMGIPSQPMARPAPAPAPVMAQPAAPKARPRTASERSYQEGIAARTKQNARYDKMRAKNSWSYS